MVAEVVVKGYLMVVVEVLVVLFKDVFQYAVLQQL